MAHDFSQTNQQTNHQLTMKTRHCDECTHCDFTVNDKMHCNKGHKPRFYMPKGTYPHFENDWGWKRKCADFEAGTPKGITRQEITTNVKGDSQSPTKKS